MLGHVRRVSSSQPKSGRTLGDNASLVGCGNWWTAFSRWSSVECVIDSRVEFPRARSPQNLPSSSVRNLRKGVRKRMPVFSAHIPPFFRPFQRLSIGITPCCSARVKTGMMMERQPGRQNVATESTDDCLQVRLRPKGRPRNVTATFEG